MARGLHVCFPTMQVLHRTCQCICRTVQTEILERLQRAANVLSFTKKKVLRL